MRSYHLGINAALVVCLKNGGASDAHFAVLTSYEGQLRLCNAEAVAEKRVQEDIQRVSQNAELSENLQKK